MVVYGLAYLVIGIATAALAGSAQSVETRNLWRLAAWLLSLVVFVGQLVHEHLRLRSSPLRAALHCAAAVALGALLLAAAGPRIGIRRVAGASRRCRSCYGRS